MPNFELHDLIATVPSCTQTTQLKVVLEILQQTQCDRLIVVDQKQYPIGAVSAARLMSRLIREYQSGDTQFMLQQEIGRHDLIERIVVLPAQLSIEQLGQRLDSLQKQKNIYDDWVVVDRQQKLLGILDRTKLLTALSLHIVPQNYPSDRPGFVRDLLLQLLERLPCPLILQTATGEVVMQNAAWDNHFGAIYNPEEVRRTVANVLDNTDKETTHTRLEQEHNNCDVRVTTPSTYLRQAPDVNHVNLQALSAIRTQDNAEFDSLYQPASRCQLGAHANTCICIFSLPNGQERIWEFAKVPLPAEDFIQSRSHEHHAEFWNDAIATTSQATTQITSAQNLYLLLATDVTEQQQLALELAAKNADLIQLNRLKDEFLSCISHELKTPLTAVLGLSTLLKDQALGELNERQSRYARLIHQSGRHLMSVVNDILDLTRMETGQLKLSLELVQIPNVCDRALDQAKASQPSTNQTTTVEEVLAEGTLAHRFTLEIEPGLDTLIADELRLRQMLAHLLANALKFTETDGEIGLRVSRWEGWIAFTVWDTGIGIPEQKQHLIFQKFQQLESPLTRRFKGTGLGLVLTRALARLHGGDVSFLSKEGQGSSFTLLLPPHPPTDFRLAISDVELQPSDKPHLQHHHLKSQLPDSKSSNRLVLLVEAVPRYIADITEQLTSLGYRVFNARSGTEALEKARRLQPGIIFLNPLLPLLSGWDVLTLLKSDQTTRQIPVIVTATRAEKERAIANRADEFVSLPVQLEVLAPTLARFCGEMTMTTPPTTPPETKNTHLASETHSSSITILRLVSKQSAPLVPQPSALNYRILEADDLEQAELLAHIWQPNVLLLDGAIAEPRVYLEQLSQTQLAALPIVTLDAAIAQIANQIKGLAVFPCLLPPEKRDTDTLLSVLRFAAGMRWKPNILVVDVPTLFDLQTLSNRVASHKNEWFQALIPYLETAGFKGVISHSWSEVLQQIRQQSVDLILICLGSHLPANVVQALQALQNEQLPPILVLNRQFDAHQTTPQLHHQIEGNRTAVFSCIEDSDVVQVNTVLHAIATEVLSPSLSMQELLDKILKTLAVNAGTN